MSLLALSCGRCKSPVPAELYNLPEFTDCPSCQRALRAIAFPVVDRPLASGPLAEQIIGAEEASCFYHPASRAIVPCESCGRFLCGLCDCELRGEHFCPACLSSGRQLGKIQKLENRRVLYDSIVLTLAALPILIFFPLFYVSLIMAPMAIFLGIKHWNSPRTLMGRTKWRLVVGLLLAVLQVLLWISLPIFYVYLIMNGRFK